MKINIAIDGPSGAGKSSISKILAKKLNYTHIDTGAMYRAVAYKANYLKLDKNNEEVLADMIRKTSILFDENNEILLDGKNISNEIRKDSISMLASNISKLKTVRKLLVEKQQNLAKNKGFIMDGRDIGTVVLKDAEVKIYLDASSDVRAKRRLIQNKELGIINDFEVLKKEIESRDYQDINRENSPLKKAEDAYLIDATNLTIDEVVERIIEIVEMRVKND